MNIDDELRLLHMLEAAEEALAFIKDRARDELDMDRMLVLALVKEIEIIGEAASHIDKATQDELPELPWHDIVNMRHRLVHAYYDINLSILWQTIKQDLPTLIEMISPVILAEDD